MTMPEMDGEEALDELRGIAPTIPILLMSGYSEQEISARFRGSTATGFVQKPFTPQRFEHALRDIL